MPKATELAGRVFFRLTVISRTRLNGRTAWACVCSCGVQKAVATSALVNGLTVSCGCWSVEKTRENGYKNRTHGHPNTGVYRTWAHMRERCRPSAAPHIREYYYDRGVRVDPRWEDFSKFISDMGPRPPGHSIDRIDSRGGYTPANCRWADVKTQNRNRSGALNLTFGGVTRNAGEWSELTGIGISSIHSRIRSGWSIERTLTQPVNKKLAKKFPPE